MPFPERGHRACRPSLNQGKNGIRTETVVKCQGAPHGREKTFWSWSWTTSPRSGRSSTFASRRGASASDPPRDTEETERIAADLEPDIVVTDVMVHSRSGLDLIKSLIESELFGHEKGAFTGATTSQPGCFELANGGTLLLNKIAKIPTSLQSKLLRVIEDQRAHRCSSFRAQ